MSLRAPFPWFGGKSRVAHIVWDYFGDVRNYVEPFAGSLAVLLNRPTESKIETVNDLDCLISNFWRALQYDPEQVAAWADWPVNEADLHARHLWLVKQVHQTDFRERMKTDPDFYDVKIAGWWVWGISQWIGSGWCATPHSPLNKKLGRADGTPQRGRPNLQQNQGVQQLITPGRTNAARTPRGIEPGLWSGRGAAGKSKPRGVHGRQQPPGDPWLKRPNLGDEGRGVHAEKRPYLSNHGGGMGVHRNVSANIRPALNETSGLTAKRPRLGNDHGRGVLSAGVPRQLPDISGDGGAAGRTIHASGCEAKGGIYDWFYGLADRLRRVRVCCGDWSRVLGPAPTTCIGLTGVFLDPPYAVDERSDVYNEESRDLAHKVREWAIANGDNPDLRIALCGYEGEHDMPSAWTEVCWKANGGFANQKREGTRGKQNAHRERIWFSPHCLRPQERLFAASETEALALTEAAV